MRLIEINKYIARAVNEEEREYWKARRDQFFIEGSEAVEATIADDIAEGFYPEVTKEERWEWMKETAREIREHFPKEWTQILPAPLPSNADWVVAYLDENGKLGIRLLQFDVDYTEVKENE